MLWRGWCCGAVAMLVPGARRNHRKQKLPLSGCSLEIVKEIHKSNMKIKRLKSTAADLSLLARGLFGEGFGALAFSAVQASDVAFLATIYDHDA